MTPTIHDRARSVMIDLCEKLPEVRAVRGTKIIEAAMRELLRDQAKEMERAADADVASPRGNRAYAGLYRAAAGLERLASEGEEDKYR